MNGNGPVVVAGLFLLTTMAVAMVAVGLFELPAYEPEPQPIELLVVEDAQFSPAPVEMLDVSIGEVPFSGAPIELLLPYVTDGEPGLSPEQISYGVAVQAQAHAIDVTKIQAHGGSCSGAY